MVEPTLWVLVLTQALVLGAAGLVGAWAAGRIGTAPLIGAVLAGILLGPSVLGELAPDAYRFLFVGGGEQLQQIQAFEEQAREAREALVQTGVTEVAVEEHDAVVARELERMRAELEQARGPQDQTLLIVAMAGIAFVMLSATRGVSNLGAWRPRLPTAATIAIGSGSLAAITAAVLVTLLAWFGWFEAPALWIAGIAIGCAASAAPIPPLLLQKPGGRDLDAPLLQISAWCVTFVLLAVIAVLAGPMDDGGSDYLLLTAAVLAVVVIAFGVGPIVDAVTDRFIAPTSDGSRTPAALVGFALVVTTLLGLAIVGPTLATVALALFVVATALRRSHNAHATLAGQSDRPAAALFSPMLMALAGVHVHLLVDFDWLLLLAVLIAFGDGKALGALLAGRGSNLPWSTGLKSGAALAGGSATPIAIILLLLLTGIIDGRAYTALILAALIAAALALPLMRTVDAAAPTLHSPQ
ncbi:MAG: cation:proton antiporter [Phycisphaeraceae bacterium]